MTHLHRILLIAWVTLGATACGDSPDKPLLETKSVQYAGSDLLPHMYDLESAFRAIEPNLRLPAAYGEVAEHARRILEIADEPAFLTYTERPLFKHDAELFEKMRLEYKRAAERALRGAESGNIEELRSGFIGLDMSCIACHKRFNPNK